MQTVKKRDVPFGLAVASVGHNDALRSAAVSDAISRLLAGEVRAAAEDLETRVATLGRLMGLFRGL